MTQNVLVKMVLESVCKYSIETVVKYCKESAKKKKNEEIVKWQLQVSITQIHKYV